ncbi:hypothetical protein JKP88DRAFT_335451 [Tribonema minus]|uniref:AN1-type domain-containing protein n=1 Tax=Tribonema minus TaxID=303371 RepID=A0A835YMJ6_9STRA|nr:hypothetical protein JKP88DRAFT_335451 [Tribonema minus]
MEVDRPQDDKDLIRDPRKPAGQKEGEEAAAAAAGGAVASASHAAEAGSAGSPAVQLNKARCFGCNKKVGLTGMACRCGYVYCSKHRYPEEHACTYDFKASERTQLAKTVVGGGAFSKVDVI